MRGKSTALPLQRELVNPFVLNRRRFVGIDEGMYVMASLGVSGLLCLRAARRVACGAQGRDSRPTRDAVRFDIIALIRHVPVTAAVASDTVRSRLPVSGHTPIRERTWQRAHTPASFSCWSIWDCDYPEEIPVERRIAKITIRPIVPPTIGSERATNFC